jgi:hypothetical protein
MTTSSKIIAIPHLLSRHRQNLSRFRIRDDDIVKIIAPRQPTAREAQTTDNAAKPEFI